jgi:hypothetical protein
MMSFVDHDKEIQIIVPTKKKIKNKKQQQKTTNKQTNKQTNKHVKTNRKGLVYGF